MATVNLMNSDLYSDYYDPKNNYIINETPVREYGSISSLARGILTILLRAGYIFIQIGSVPISDVNLILLQNLLEISTGTISFGLVGYLFAFGEDYHGILGLKHWIMSTEADMDYAIIGWSAVMTTTAIFTTMVAGRMHFVGYFIVTAMIGALVQPLVMHWIWSKAGFMHKYTFVNQLVSYKDMGGGAVIHILAGVVALYAATFMGRRLMRLRDIDESSIPPSAPATMVVGYLLVLLGLIGLGLPTPYYEMTHIPNNYSAMILMNNIMAAAGGILVVIILQFICARENFNIWVLLRCLQGAIAAVVVIAPGVDVYNPIISLGLSVPAGVIFFFASKEIFKTPLEDYCNLISIHLICGFLGTLLPPLCGTGENLGTSATHLMVVHFGWQAVCDLILLAVYLIFFLPLFVLLNCSGCLRNRFEEHDHRRALTVISRGPERSCMQRLFRPNSDPDVLLPGYDSKNENYQEAKLAEEIEMNLRYLNPGPKTGTSAKETEPNSRIYNVSEMRTQASRATSPQMYMAITNQKYKPDEVSECKEITNILKDSKGVKENENVVRSTITSNFSTVVKSKSEWPGGDAKDRILKGDSESLSSRRKKGIYTMTESKKRKRKTDTSESVHSDSDEKSDEENLSLPEDSSSGTLSSSDSSIDSFVDVDETMIDSLELSDNKPSAYRSPTTDDSVASDQKDVSAAIAETEIHYEMEIAVPATKMSTTCTNVNNVDDNLASNTDDEEVNKNLDFWFGSG